MAISSDVGDVERGFGGVRHQRSRVWSRRGNFDLRLIRDARFGLPGMKRPARSQENNEKHGEKSDS